MITRLGGSGDFNPKYNETHTPKQARFNKLIKPPSKRVKIFKNMHFRRLTLKSGINFGNHADYTVEELIKRGKHIALIDFYFNLSHITFFDDVLDILKITPEWRIQKPGIDKEKGHEFKHSVYSDEMAIRSRKYEKMIRSDARETLKYMAAVTNDKQYNKTKNQG